MVFLDAGVRPRSGGPIVSSKGPKTKLAVAWPSVFPALFTVAGSAKARCAQTLLAFSPVPIALLGHATRPGNSLERK